MGYFLSVNFSINPRLSCLWKINCKLCFIYYAKNKCSFCHVFIPIYIFKFILLYFFEYMFYWTFLFKKCALLASNQVSNSICMFKWNSLWYWITFICFFGLRVLFVCEFILSFRFFLSFWKEIFNLSKDDLGSK